MSSTDGSITEKLHQMKTGNEQATEQVWNRYFRRLVGLVRHRLGGRRLGEADEEDVAALAFASFCDGLKHDRFPKMENRDDLWKLLAAIASRKSCDAITRSRRQKRGGGLVATESAMPGTQGADGLIADGPTPEFQVSTEEWLDGLLNCLSDEVEKKIALLRLDGWAMKEIAKELGVSLRTVERRLNMIREKWSQQLDRPTDEH